jgi:hypothetical protein
VDLLSGLARQMGTVYRKPVQGPMIAKHLGDNVVEQLRPVLLPKLSGEEPGAN